MCDRNCENCKKTELYQIPYIEHKRRIFKAYREKNIVLGFLIGTNFFWAMVVILMLLAR